MCATPRTPISRCGRSTLSARRLRDHIGESEATEQDYQQRLQRQSRRLQAQSYTRNRLEDLLSCRYRSLTVARDCFTVSRHTAAWLLKEAPTTMRSWQRQSEQAVDGKGTLGRTHTAVRAALTSH